MRAAGAERDVVVRLAGDVEPVGIGERALVAVRRRVHEHDAVAGRDRLPGDLGVGCTAVRVNCITGLTQRNSSSIAVGSSDRSARSRSSWSGWSSSTSVPVVIRLRVVSLPAFCSSMKKRSICICVRVSPFTSAVINTLIRSSRGSARRCFAELVGVHVHRDRGLGPLVGRHRLVEAERQLGPLEHLLAIGLGNAHEVGDHVQRAATTRCRSRDRTRRVRPRATRRCRRPGRGCGRSSSATRRGVKPVLISFRSLECSGGSWLISSSRHPAAVLGHPRFDERVRRVVERRRITRDPLHVGVPGHGPVAPLPGPDARGARPDRCPAARGTHRAESRARRCRGCGASTRTLRT